MSLRKTMFTVIVIAISGIAIVVLALPTLFYINNPAGGAINPEVTENYRIGKWNKNKVYHSSGGGFMSLGREIIGTTPKNFQPINGYYAKDGNHVYFEYSRIDVDYNSFYLDGYIPKDKNHVYYRHNFKHNPISIGQAPIIEGADPKTYKELESYTYWGKDKTHYYFKTQRINADYASFEFIDRLWAKDKNFVYLLNGLGIEKTMLDIATFKQIHDNHSQDDKQIVFAGWVEGEPTPVHITLPLTPGSSIEVLSSIHLKHDNKIYLRGTPFDVDIDSFHAFIFDEETLSTNDGFSKDKNHVYLYDKVLKEADPETFTITNGRPKDKNNEYWENGKIRPKIKE